MASRRVLLLMHMRQSQQQAQQKAAQNKVDGSASTLKTNPSSNTQSLAVNPKQFYSSYSSQEFADKSAQGSEFFNMTKQRGTLFGN